MTNSATKGGADPDPSVEWAGSLEHTPLAEVFRRIAVEERSGDLTVSNPSATKTVYFDQGFVVFASSSLKNDRLGERMIEAGRISRHEFALASRLMEGGRRKFGQALVEAGIVSEEELGRHVAAQVNRIVLSLFSLKQGTYSFDERPCSIPLDLMVSLSVYRILIDGIRRMRRKKLVLAGLPPLDSKLKIVTAPPFTLNVYKLRSEERAVLRLVREGLSLREIAGAVGGNEGVVLRACYALYAAGVVETAAYGARAHPRRVQEETGTFMVSEIRRKVAKRPESADAASAPADPEPARRIVEQVPFPPSSPEAAAPPNLEREEGPRPERVPSSDGVDEEPPLDTAGTEALQISDKGWTLSQVVSDAVRFLELTVWNPIWGFARRLYESLTRRAEAQEQAEISSPAAGDEAAPPRPAIAPPDAQVPHIDLAQPTWSEEEESTHPKQASVEEARGEDLVMEIIGIPSWSVKDDPNEPIEPSTDFSEKETEEEPTVERLGVPKWSMMDDPYDRSKAPVSLFEEDPEQEPVVEDMRAPAWSILDDSSDLEEESPVSHETTETHEPLPEIELELEEPAVAARPNATVESQDSDLFVEEELGGDDPSSMLNHIPVEEIKLDPEPPELEIEIEIEEATFEDPTGPAQEPSTPPPREPKPSEPREQAAEVTARAMSSTSPRPAEEYLPEGHVLSAPEEEGEEEVAVSPEEQGLRASRMRVGGGEERLLRDVRLHFQCRDWAGAVRLLEQLVQTSPGSAFYRGLLARAMSRHPAMRDNAEKHFVEALRLSPQDAQLHYWLGLYYKSYGLKSRAVNEFRTTLRIDPRHEGARKQFAGAGGKRGEAIGSVLKKFFS